MGIISGQRSGTCIKAALVHAKWPRSHTRLAKMELLVLVCLSLSVARAQVSEAGTALMFDPVGRESKPVSLSSLQKILFTPKWGPRGHTGKCSMNLL